ncbi:putative nuclease HARBI1 isoform X1 [Ixodes scapularis]
MASSLRDPPRTSGSFGRTSEAPRVSSGGPRKDLGFLREDLGRTSGSFGKTSGGPRAPSGGPQEDLGFHHRGAVVVRRTSRGTGGEESAYLVDGHDCGASSVVCTALLRHGELPRHGGERRTRSAGPKTVSVAVRAVSVAIVRRLGVQRGWIHFPETPSERFDAEKGFRLLGRIPGVIGCVDGTMVSIVGPSKNDPTVTKAAYWCRKYFYALNVMVVCDADCRIMCIDPRYPGSVHDSFVWQFSWLRNQLEQGQVPRDGRFLLGDSGYPLEPWLITPVPGNHATSTACGRFNKAHSSIRSVVERCIGLLKNRFRCLQRHRALYYHPSTATAIISACAVLHNICLASSEPEPESDSDPEESELESEPSSDGSEPSSERLYREHRDAFELPEEIFRKQYRLPKIVVRWLCDELREEPEVRRVRTSWTVMTVELQVLCALRFYGTGSFQGMVASDEHVARDQKTVSVAVRAVSVAIVRRLGVQRGWIHFPETPSERFDAEKGFRLLGRIPGVIGCVDGTMVSIVGPSKNDPTVTKAAYWCRKYFYALNVMVVCDADCRIMCIDPRYPGSVHDSFVWQFSWLRNQLEQGQLPRDGRFLLGDSGYPLEPWLITPVPGNHATSTACGRFNKAHSSISAPQHLPCIERARTGVRLRP